MFGKIFSIKTDIVYRREESLNLFDGKKKLDKVVSGRVVKEQILLFGHILRTKFVYSICLPQIDKNDVHANGMLEKVKGFVEKECKNKVVEYSNKK